MSIVKISEEAHLSTGITVPTLFYRIDNIQRPNTLVISHGLGAKNPKLTTHSSDKWIPVLFDAAEKVNFSYIAYTVRGHGQSSGWQSTAESDLNQFTWNRLADDMVCNDGFCEDNRSY